MPDEASIPQSEAVGQAPKNSKLSTGQATPPPSSFAKGYGATREAEAPAPESEQVSEDLTGKPNTPTNPVFQENTTPEPLPLEDSVLPLSPTTPSSRSFAAKLRLDTPPRAGGVGVAPLW